MNWKKFFIAVIVVLVALMAMDFIINVLILADAYEPLMGTTFRAEADMNARMWAMYLGEIIFAFMFVWIYSYGVKGKGIMEGLRYGLYIGLLYIPVSSLGMWASIEISGWFTWMWMIFGMIEILVLGLLAGAIYKPDTA
ncbi:MAG: hypothetical protein V3W18_10625 [candidate division Zixibacteria bacterium]